MTAPLRKLTRKNVVWKWTLQHKSAVDTLKEALKAAPALSYFDPNKETELVVDASPVGLGVILTQEDNNDKLCIVAY